MCNKSSRPLNRTTRLNFQVVRIMIHSHVAISANLRSTVARWEFALHRVLNTDSLSKDFACCSTSSTVCTHTGSNSSKWISRATKSEKLESPVVLVVFGFCVFFTVDASSADCWWRTVSSMGLQRLLHFNRKCRRRTPAIPVQLDQSYLYVGVFVLKHPRVVVTPGWYAVRAADRTGDKQEIN